MANAAADVLATSSGSLQRRGERANAKGSAAPHVNPMTPAQTTAAAPVVNTMPVTLTKKRRPKHTYGQRRPCSLSATNKSRIDVGIWLEFRAVKDALTRSVRSTL